MPEAVYAASSPTVELRLGAALLPAEIAAITAANSSANPEESVKQALRTYVAYAQRKAQEDLLDVVLLDDTIIRRTLDTAWQLFTPSFVKATGPMIAEAYINAFRAADAGDVPIQMIYNLADEHAVRLGTYFNSTSNEALTQGFNTYVNRQIPKKAAFQRVLQAYGLSPRQMSGFTSATQLQPQKVESASKLNLARQVKEYIAKSLSDRFNLFGTQEAHNLDEQAKQIAWTWLVEKKRLPATAEKMWLTAKDELVCKQCGPMHGRKTPLKEQFTLPNGTKLYTPGAHVNCRCEVRLQVNPFKVVKSLTPISKAQPFRERDVRRDRRGRFAEEPEQAELDRLMELASAYRERERREKLQEEIDAAKEAQPEETKPRLTVNTPTTRLTTTPSLSVNPKLTTRPKLSIKDSELSATPQLKTEGQQLSTQAKLAVVEAKLDALKESPELKVDFARGLQLSEIKRATNRKVKEQFRDTVKLTNSRGDKQPGYAVVDYTRVDHYSNRLMITEEDEIKVFEKKVGADDLFGAAVDQFGVHMNNEAERVMDGKDFAIVEKKDPVHGTLHAEVDYDLVISAIDASVNKNSGWSVYPQITLNWTNSRGVVVYDIDNDEKAISPLELSRLLKIQAEDLEVIIVVMEEGYDDTFVTDESHQDYGYTTWSAPGNYEIISEHKHGSPNYIVDWDQMKDSEIRVPIRMIHVAPEVDTDFYIERDAYPGE